MCCLPVSRSQVRLPPDFETATLSVEDVQPLRRHAHSHDISRININAVSNTERYQLESSLDLTQAH